MARHLCRAFCMAGLCVTVTPTEFIYTGGAESGVAVGLINYPRFPAEPAEIFAKAEALALHLIDGLHQHSASIVASDKTAWLSRRLDDPTPVAALRQAAKQAEQSA
jgi:hypothetical protein